MFIRTLVCTVVISAFLSVAVQSCNSDLECDARWPGRWPYTFQCCTTILCNDQWGYYIVHSGCTKTGDCLADRQVRQGNRFAARIPFSTWQSKQSSIRGNCERTKSELEALESEPRLQSPFIISWRKIVEAGDRNTQKQRQGSGQISTPRGATVYRHSAIPASRDKTIVGLKTTTAAPITEPFVPVNIRPDRTAVVRQIPNINDLTQKFPDKGFNVQVSKTPSPVISRPWRFPGSFEIQVTRAPVTSSSGLRSDSFLSLLTTEFPRRQIGAERRFNLPVQSQCPAMDPICKSIQDQQCCVRVKCRKADVFNREKAQDMPYVWEERCVPTCQRSAIEYDQVNYEFYFTPKEWWDNYEAYKNSLIGKEPLGNCRETHYFLQHIQSKENQELYEEYDYAS